MESCRRKPHGERAALRDEGRVRLAVRASSSAGFPSTDRFAAETGSDLDGGVRTIGISRILIGKCRETHCCDLRCPVGGSLCPSVPVLVVSPSPSSAREPKPTQDVMDPAAVTPRDGAGVILITSRKVQIGKRCTYDVSLDAASGGTASDEQLTIYADPGQRSSRSAFAMNRAVTLRMHRFPGCRRSRNDEDPRRRGRRPRPEATSEHVGRIVAEVTLIRLNLGRRIRSAGG